MMKKRILSFVLILCVSMCLMPFVATAQTPETVTVRIPFTKTVELGGNSQPESTEFTLELVQTEPAVDISDITYSGSVTITGSGTFDGELKIEGPYDKIINFLTYGAYFGEKNTGKENWTYSDEVWAVVLNSDTITELPQTTVSAKLYKASFELGVGRKYYYYSDQELPVSSMSFTNIYEKFGGNHDNDDK